MTTQTTPGGVTIWWPGAKWKWPTVLNAGTWRGRKGKGIMTSWTLIISALLLIVAVDMARKFRMAKTERWKRESIGKRMFPRRKNRKGRNDKLDADNLGTTADRCGRIPTNSPRRILGMVTMAELLKMKRQCEYERALKAAQQSGRALNYMWAMCLKERERRHETHDYDKHG